jgi:putative ABC transport system permease protein
MSASGFRGRVLVADDERAAAPAVAVIGYELWQTRFGGASDVIGRTVQLGHDPVTVVGVMREGFAFPVSHELWTPLKAEMLDQGPRSGPSITVFGLLAPGVSLETAQAELTTLGRRVAIDRPATHERLEPRAGGVRKRVFAGVSRRPGSCAVGKDG